MLVLTRKQGETVVVDGKILIHVLGIHGSKIRLGIDAPAEVPVHRKEILQRQAVAAHRPKAVA